MKQSMLIGVFTLCCTASYAQLKKERNSAFIRDSIKAHYIDSLAWMIPTLRQAGLSTEVFAPGNIKSNLKGNSFFEGKYQTVRTNAFFNASLLKVKKNIFSAGIAVSHQTMDIYNVTSYDANLPMGATKTHNTLLGGSITFTRVDSLFRHPIVYSATANAITDPATGQYRLAYTGLMTLTLKHTANSNLSVGLLVLLDPTAPTPVVPFISYYHQFRNGYSFSLDPSAIALRKNLNARNSIALSNNIAGNISLFRRDIVNLPMDQVYTTFEMKSGIIYEHKMTNKAILGISGGVSSTFTSKVGSDNNLSNPFIKNTQSMVPFIKMSISFLPFWKGLVK